MWRGPLAYGHATATRIRWGARFFEAFLRADRDLRHLTEGPFSESASRRRFPSQPAAGAEQAERKAHAAEGEQRHVRRLGALPSTSSERARPRRANPIAPLGSEDRGGVRTTVHGPSDPCLRNGISTSRTDPPDFGPDPFGRHPRVRLGLRLRPAPGRPPARRGPPSRRRPRSSPSRDADGRPSRRDLRAHRRRGGRDRWRLRLRFGLGRRAFRRGHGRAHGIGRRRGLRGPSAARREERERVEVPVRLGGQPDAQVDVRLGDVGVATRADRPHHLPFADRRAHWDGDRVQLEQRDRVAVLGANRDRAPGSGHRARKRDDAGRRRAHLGADRRADVDAPVLASAVRIVAGRERAQHRPFDRPGPGPRHAGQPQSRYAHDGEKPKAISVVRSENHAGRT
jgi:hypothetical protein